MASSGNLVEWFDFYTYAFCAIYFAPAFFPKSDSTAQLLQTAGVFAAGFLMRPIGGWMFGRLGDRVGRKSAMVVSVTLMCVGSLMIAFAPTYATLGALAPAWLLLARLIQGISVGGEYGTTATYMSEVALHGRRGFYSSFQYVTSSAVSSSLSQSSSSCSNSSTTRSYAHGAGASRSSSVRSPQSLRSPCVVRCTRPRVTRRARATAPAAFARFGAIIARRFSPSSATRRAARSSSTRSRRTCRSSSRTRRACP